MGITLTVTCDTEEELARVLENLSYTESGQGPRKSPANKPVSQSVPLKKRPSSGKQTRTRSSKLLPIIESAIQKMVQKGKPFRTKDVTKLVLKDNPKLNENSITTGVTKLLNQAKLKHTLIKDNVGRPYKLYKP